MIIASSHLISHMLGKLSNSGEKALKACYEILTTSLIKLETQRFPKFLLSIHVNSDLTQVVVFKVEGVGSVRSTDCFCIH